MTTETGSGGTLRVVVADDEPFTVSLVAGGLEAQGFDVVTASTVAEAWDAVEREHPHALITDLDFGGGPSGATLLERVNHDYPWVGLVVLTSHRSPELAVANSGSIPDGCVYLVKSALRQVEELADAVHRAIAGQPIAEDPAESADHMVVVTQAQAEVLRMLAHGASTRAVAEHRGTTVRAAESMLARLFTALGIAADDRSNPRIEAVSLWQQGRITVRQPQ
jgi:DNA-binding NarL/FixJ family response regulator